ncbi:MAG: GAF domain-containing protein [Desulfovibrio sp.]|jgi:signal transduction protein with GAF and PtsI domain|nr:GAF domain-containing protein [Desulfovibrio sp.]
MIENSFEKRVLNIVCSVFDAYSAVLFQPEEAGEACRLAAWFSLGDKIAPDVSILPGKGLVGWIIRNRQPILYSHFDRQSSLGYYMDSEEASIKAFMGCPVPAPAGGALCVDSKRQYSFTDKDHKILQLFAELVSRQKNVDDRKESTTDIPRYFAELDIIQNLRFRYNRWPQFLQNYLHAVTEAAGFEYGAFASVETQQETYCVECETKPLLLSGGQSLVLPMGSGIVGWVFRHGQPVITEGAQGSPTSMIFGKLPVPLPEFQAVVCQPVIVNKTASGVLCLAHRGEKNIDEGMRSFVRQGVDHLALFLENLYLKNRLRAVLPKARVHSEGAHAYDPDRASATTETVNDK